MITLAMPRLLLCILCFGYSNCCYTEPFKAGIITYNIGSGDDAEEFAVLFHLPTVPGSYIRVGDVRFAREWYHQEDQYSNQDQQILPVWAWPLPEGCNQRIFDVMRAECAVTLNHITRI